MKPVLTAAVLLLVTLQGVAQTPASSAGVPDLSGHWDADTGFTRATGATYLPINAVKVVARRTADSPETGGPVSLFFGHIVDWPVMGVSRVATLQPRNPIQQRPER